ncbi:dynein heavy chain 6, axonemal [Aplysia californica]|uniref:Dynein heavy chain 6, axonemal n=1 Tax=Aplysia californica TaxID=6500 RepID=A0ABM1VS79_APLCA|nr:dynein heavy chain 6, axonemal [Aplysia californica]
MSAGKMTDVRGDSMASPQSQYSNGSVLLNSEFREPDSLGQSRASKLKSTRFNMSSISYPEMESAQSKKQFPVPEPISLQARLRDRLYDKPETSGVVQYVKMQSVRKRPASGGDDLTGLPNTLKRSTVLEPLPTSLPRKTAGAHQDMSKSSAKWTAQETSILQNIINRKRPGLLAPLETPRDLSSSTGEASEFDELDYEEGLKMQEVDMMEELFSPRMSYETGSPSKTEASSVLKRGTDTSMLKSRNVTSTSRLTRTDLEEDLDLELDLDGNEFNEVKGDKDFEAMKEKRAASETLAAAKQIQIVINQHDLPAKLPDRSKSAGVDTKRSFDSKKTKMTTKSQSTSYVSSKPDPSKMLSYLKRNKYDDKVPENTNVLETLIEMRTSLGWVLDIPRHGPDTREKMEKLSDIPEDEKEAAKAKEDNGEFFYCLPRNRNNLRARYNPYDLQIVSPNTARSKPMYFSVSASYITMCYEDESKMNESNATPALWWLWERRLFYMVFHFPVFVKFRLWKAFKNWKKAIHRQKNKGSQVKLYKSLFIANEVLQGCLVHVRSLCESARSVFKDGDTSSIIALVDLDPVATLTLQEFEGRQKNRCDRALHQLNTLREKIIEIVWESCATVAEMEGITQGIREEGDRKVLVKSAAVKAALAASQQNRLKIRQTFGDGNLTKKEEEEKKNKPLYAEIAEWRKILSRLSCFLRCVDYILQDLLRHLVFSAAQNLLDHLVTSYHAQDDEDSEDEDDEDSDDEKGSSTSRTTPMASSSRQSTLADVDSSLSFLSENQKKAAGATKTPEVYVIPHYDFDKVEEVEGPPDIDEILEEIKRRDVVEEVINPVFTINLVLNVPSGSSKSSRSKTPEGGGRKGKGRVKWALPGDQGEGGDKQKGVSFQDEESSSESEYDSEYESGDSSDSDGSRDRSMDSGVQPDQYAYPETTKEDTHLPRKAVVSLSPCASEFQASIQSMICYFEDTVIQVVPMLREPKLAVFYSPPRHDLKLKFDEEQDEERREMMNEWPDLDLILRDDPAYQRLLSGMLSYMDMEMELLEQYATNYDTFCQMVDQSKKMHVEDSLNKKPWSTDEFNQVLATHSEMIRRMNKMNTSHRVAMVQVQADNFRGSCLPFPQAVVNAVNKFLPIIANKHNDDLITIIKGASKRLDKTILKVEEFVEHLSFLGRMSTELPALEKEYNVVNKMFTIAKDYNIDIMPEDMALYQTLSPSFQHLKSTILYCEAKKDDNIRKFSSQLDTLISDIRSTLMDLKSRVQDPELLHTDTHALSALETVRLLQEEVQTLSVKARSYASYQDRFGSSLSKQKRGYYGEVVSSDKKSENNVQEIQTDLSEIERDLTLRGLLWQSLEEWGKLVEDWTTTSFDSINVEGLQKNVNKFTQTVYMLEKGLPHNEVVPRLKEKVMDFKQGMPVITSLRNPSLRQRHWEEIQRIINKTISRDKTFTLGNLLEMNIFKHKEKIQEIATTASNEATLEQMLQKVIDLWLSTDFRLVPHVGRDTLVIYGADDIMAQLEESQVTVGTIRGSRYVTPIKAQVEEWERKLQVFSRTLDEWLNCQRNWLYLEQIFSTPDIQRQLPSEYKLFMSVDKAWKDIMRRTEDRPNALKSAITPGTLDTLQQANANLEKVQRCLEDYLETKRFVFPRFYFLSNDELLDILAQSKDPNAVQPHLGKCFGNIKQLDIRMLPRQPPTVKSIISAEKEVIAMPRNVRARGAVEQWLGTVEAGMFETVKKHLKLGLSDWLATGLKDWVLRHPGQVVLTVIQIMFNKDMTKCFESTESREALKQAQDRIVELLNQLASFTSARLHSYQRMSIEALLTITVHNRDILLSMIQSKVRKGEDFEWKRQLRYEWDETTNNCQVLQSNAHFQYGYEYLGCSTRLVITPLTDRCYLTLTGALHLHLGGSPAGPAGTGKTETVKDLAKAMGKQCVVFNCSEGLDYKMLGKFFSGLAQSGSWCCFDEFNRIDVEVLSVVAMQIHTIKTAKDAQSLRFMFEGRDIKLNPTCGYFITMNPTYAGRVELPDNLKYLFRPVAMMVPDYVLIAEIMLFSEGFTAARILSHKLVNLYQLASKQLSQQDHYDFGMRAIKSVLVMAGHGRRAMLQKDPLRIKDIKEEDEAYILIHSLRDANMPKFLAEDVPLFESILDDLFPGVVPPEPDHGALEKAISMSIRDQSLQHWPNQIDKVKQLYNQIQVRHGVMLVGPTGGGKTTVRNVLQKALVILPMMHPQHVDQEQQEAAAKRPSVFFASRGKKGHVETFIVNPKCVKLGELYGETDPNTFEWSDGLIANATRKFSKDLSSTLPVVSAAEDLKPGNGATTSNRPLSNMTDISVVSHTTLGTTKTGTTSQQGTELETAPPSAMDSHRDGEKEEDEDGKEGNITDWRWLVLDGPVDTLWVENLNTVLDDSKVLCLASGERIALAPGMRLLFEVDNLSRASPATVSRCAMVYMDPVDLGWKPYVKTWLNRLPRDMPESGKNFLQALFDASMDKGLVFLHKYREHQAVQVPAMSIVGTLCHILSAYVNFIGGHGGFGAPDEKEKEKEKEPSSLKPSSPEDLRNASRTSSRTTGTGSRASKLKRRQTKRLGKTKEEADTSDDLHGSKQKNSDRKMFFLERHPTQLTNLLGKLFVFAYTWSVGGVLKRREFMEEDDSSIKRAGAGAAERLDVNNEFDNFARELFDVEPPLGVRLPAGNRSIYGYFVDMEAGNFVPWDVLIPSTKSMIEKGAVITIGETLGVASDKKKQELKEAEIIPTVDIIRFSFLTSLMLLNKQPVLLAGESGVGKTAIINHMLKELERDGGTSMEKTSTILGAVLQYSEKQSTLLENISSLTSFQADDDDKTMDLLLGAKGRLAGIVSTMIQCSAQTTSKRLQAQIMLKLIKKSRTSMGAPKGRKVIVFVDDLNMPSPEEYGAQPPLELLRQFLELGGFYDTKKLVWKDILDVTVVAACGPPGGGRNPTTPRLLKHFCLFTLPQPSTKSLQHIYQVQLGRFLQDGEFMPEVMDCLFPLVSASIAVYYHMCVVMLPTPTKSHYTFNIRDLSKVIQGLLQAHDTVVMGKDNCAQLFAHETTRVFHDRLINTEDRQTFFQILSETLHDYFKVRWTPQKLVEESVVFGDFFDMNDHSNQQRVYRPLADQSKLVRVLEEYNMRMSAGEQKEQLVFFKDAVEHVVRAARVFRQPGGHLMLVGLDGTGKSTIIHLASFIGNCEMFRLKLHNQYGMAEFRDDLKVLFVRAGVKGIPTVFLLTDSDIVKESFLEDINCILNSGEVPDLFDNEELDGITMELKSAASEAGVPDTRASVYGFFIQRIRQKLHVVLTMSPAGDIFRQRCRMNPALINCCTIDWFDEWTDEAMLSVAEVFFADVEFIADEARYDKEALKDKVAQICVDIHKSIASMSVRFWEEARRRYYSTPSSYMELIKLYSKMLKDNKREFMSNRDRLQNGLTTLSNAYSMVGVMQDELRSLGPIIVQKTKDTELLLKQLEEDQQAVEEVQEIVSQEEAIMAKETQIVQDYADECESDLASVLPVLQAAIASLETLDKASISEIRVYTKPPQLVATVIAAVCVLFQKKPDWSSGKLFLGDPQFLKMLLNFDRNNQPDKVYTRLKKYTKDPNFNPEAVGKVSLACKCICSWVLAIDNYNTVYKMVKPKQRRVQDAKEALKLAQDSLAKKQASLRKIQTHLELIQKQYQDSVNQKEALIERQHVTGLRLQRAGVLISALADEEVRWSQSVKFLDMKLEGIVGDTLVGAASVAYLGAFTAHYRHLLLDTWVSMCKDTEVPVSKDFDLIRSMVDANQVMKWHNNGLPRDKLSTENATFVSRARKWPLFIDPQGQAGRWIREKEGSKLKTVLAVDTNLMRTIETAIKVGDAVLLKDLGEELDPALRPVLLHETIRKGGQMVMKIGDVEIEYNQNFRLYLSTSLANPHYLPSIYLQVNIINFTVTFDGLQEQLLSAVVHQERPILEKQRTELLESIANDRQTLRDLEDKSLSMLQSSEGDEDSVAGHLLDDQDLIVTLEQSKDKSQEIYKRVAESEETEKSLNLARKRYLPVATRGSVLYFVIAELANVDVMYQYSLTWFQGMFATCISDSSHESDDNASISSSSSQAFASGVLRPSSARSIKSMHNDKDKEEAETQPVQLALSVPGDKQELMAHLRGMIDRLTYNIYRIVSVGLFSNHQLIYSFMLCSSIMQANNKFVDETTEMEAIQENEWQIFLQGNIAAARMIDKTVHKQESSEEEANSGEETSAKPPSVNSSESEEKPSTEAEHPPHPSWVTESEWRQCQYLEATIPSFDLLCRSLCTNTEQWQLFKSSEDPFFLMEQPFVHGPDADKSSPIFPWEGLTKFQRLILIKTLRLEVTPSAVSQFIRDQLGARYLSTGTFDLKEIYRESMAKAPLIFILSPGEGCDPSSQLLRFAKELRGSTLHLDMISLGRGQGPKAEELISKAQILKGRWVFLQNCHLAASWMPKLQSIVEKFNQPNEENLDPQFRLWLSSRPDPSFPVSILQTGIKMTVESPQGLKANLLRTFGSSGAGVVTEKLYDEGSSKPGWRPLLYGLCLFNSVIHERKRYGTLGWNIPYEFNDSDLEVAILKLQMLLEVDEQEDVPWAALNYLTGQVTYGGRVTDDLDRRCLISLLNKFYCPGLFQADFSYDSNHMYQPVPETLNFNSVISFVEELPDYDTPDIFGMTENAEKACREFQANNIVETVICMQPRMTTGLTGSQKSSDAVVLDIASDIAVKLPRCVEDDSESPDPALLEPQRSLKAILQKDVETRGLDKEKIKILENLTSELTGNSALLTVLRQEIDRFNQLLGIIHSSLNLLSLAVKGEIVMSEPLEEAYQAILTQHVPSQWKNAAYESTKPLASWVTDLQNRVKFFYNWAKLLSSTIERKFRQIVRNLKEVEGEWDGPPVTTPTSFWLPAFFFPQGFLTAILQNHARKMSISVDSLSFRFTVVKEISESSSEHSGDRSSSRASSAKEAAFSGASPEDGVLINGLYLDGARWDPVSHSLQDCATDSRFCSVPEIHFEPVENRDIVSASTRERTIEELPSQSQKQTKNAPKPEKVSYECPLYRTSERAGTLSSTGHSTNFVTSVNLPSEQPEDFWILRGVAMVCQLDE